jgi:hypothetical protein
LSGAARVLFGDLILSCHLVWWFPSWRLSDFFVSRLSNRSNHLDVLVESLGELRRLKRDESLDFAKR